MANREVTRWTARWRSDGARGSSFFRGHEPGVRVVGRGGTFKFREPCRYPSLHFLLPRRFPSPPCSRSFPFGDSSAIPRRIRVDGERRISPRWRHSRWQAVGSPLLLRAIPSSIFISAANPRSRTFPFGESASTANGGASY